MQLIGYVPDFTDYHEWYKYPEQQSSPVSLVAGQKYFIMVMHKAGTGNDNMSQWPGRDRASASRSSMAYICLPAALICGFLRVLQPSGAEPTAMQAMTGAAD